MAANGPTYQRTPRSRRIAATSRITAQRVHGDALEPAQPARREVGHLGEVEAARRGGGGDEEGDPQRGVVDGGDELGRGGRTGAQQAGDDQHEGAGQRHQGQQGEEQLRCVDVHGPEVWALPLGSGRARSRIRDRARSDDVLRRFAPGCAGTGDGSSVRRRMSSVVQELRRTRRGRRLGDLEWFDVAYKVYIAALVGGGVIVWLSGLVTDDPASAGAGRDVLDHGPAVLGFAVAVAVGPRPAQRQRRRPDLRRGRRRPPPPAGPGAPTRRAGPPRRPAPALGGVRRRPRRRASPASWPPVACPGRRRPGPPAVPSPVPPPGPCSSPPPCSSTSGGSLAGWRPALAVIVLAVQGSGHRRRVPRAVRHDRQRRPLGHAPGARRPRRRRRRARAGDRRRRWSPGGCAWRPSCAAPTSCRSCGSP